MSDKVVGDSGGGGNPADKEKLEELARAVAQAAAQGAQALQGAVQEGWMEESAPATDLPKPAEHVGEGLRKPAEMVSFGFVNGAEAFLKARASQLEQAKKRTTALSFLAPGQAELEKQSLKSLERDLEAARKRRDALSQEFQKSQYAMLPLEPDWEEKSQYRSTANGKDVSYTTGYSYTPGYGYGFATSIPRETGFQDERYDYINKNPQAIKLVDNNDTITESYFLGLDKNHLKQMTGEEVKTYNYLYARDGKEKAEEYLKFITPGLTDKQRRQEEEEAARESREDPVGTSAASVVASPLKGLTYLSQLADFAGDGKIDQNAAYNRNSYKSAAVRREVSKIAEENWGKPGSFLYNTGMSMGDFLMATALTGGNQGLSLAILGTGAAADATIAAKDRGLEDWQAFTLGSIAGAAEVATEKVSLGTLLDKTSLGKDAVGYLLKNVLAEGTEEVGSDLINLTADLLVSQEKSEWEEAIRSYREKGFSEREAFELALGDQVEKLGWDFLGGALSGGVMAGAAVGGSYAYQGAQNLGLLPGSSYGGLTNGGPFPGKGEWAGQPGERILYPEPPAGVPQILDPQEAQSFEPDARWKLPDWYEEQPGSGLLPEEAKPALPEQALSPQQAAGEEAARALTQLLVNEGYFTPEEAAEMMGQNRGPELALPEEKSLLYPDWDSGEQEGLPYPDRFRLPGIEDFLMPESGRGLFQISQPQALPEEFQRPQGVSDWDWSFRVSNAEDAKTDLEKSAALYDVGKTKLDVAKRISEELGRKVVFDGTLPVDKTGVVDPETGTIRLNARVGGPQNLRDNAMQLVQEESAGLDSAGSGGYNAKDKEKLWEIKENGKIDEIPIDSYKNLRVRKEVKGQAHHLNQNAVFRSVIPRNEGMAIKLKGNIRTQISSSHYNTHRSLEGFWNKYREGGDLQGEIPTLSEYNSALYESLIEGGLSESLAKKALQAAVNQQMEFGLSSETRVPRVPGRINLPK